MDPIAKQALADLKDLLREKVITLAEWREEVAAIHNRLLTAAAPARDEHKVAPAPTRAPRAPAPPPPRVELERTVQVG